VVIVVVVITIVVVVMITVMIMVVVMPLVLLVPLLATLFVPFLLVNHVLLVSPLLVLVALVFPGTDVTWGIFRGLHEVHLPVASVILVTMQAPGPGVLGRNMQVNRFRYDNVWRRLLDDDRSRIDQRRRRPAADVHATIDARRNFTADHHSNIHIRIGSSGSERQSRQCCHAIYILHNQPFSPDVRACTYGRKVAERLQQLE
jgi:hypothetical protein